MSRRRRGHVLRDVAALPWWMGVGVAAIVWIGMRHGLPAWWADEPLLAALATAAHRYAPWVTAVFLIAAGWSWWQGRARARDRRQLLDRHTDLVSIRALPWARFEQLVGEAYRRQGYAVRENPSGGADGGVDLVLRRDDELALVQCKRWSGSVGVPVVRELLGAMTAAGAARGIVVTTAGFTKPARAFASTNRITLVDGPALQRLIGDLGPVDPPEAGGTSVPASTPAPAPPRDARPAAPDRLDPPAVACPRCGAPMTRRVARRGPRTGGAFLGCTRFPACRETRSLD